MSNETYDNCNSKSSTNRLFKLKESLYQIQKRKIQDVYEQHRLFHQITNTFINDKNKKFTFNSSSKNINDDYSYCSFSSVFISHDEVPLCEGFWLHPQIICSEDGINIKSTALKSKLQLESVK